MKPMGAKTQSQAGALHILILDNDALFRDGLAAVLETYFATVEEAPSGYILSHAAPDSQRRASITQTPDIVLVDAESLIAANGQAMQKIRSRWQQSRVVGLALYNQQVDRVLSVGADACLLKGCTTEELLQTIGTVTGLAGLPKEREDLVINGASPYLEPALDRSATGGGALKTTWDGTRDRGRPAGKRHWNLAATALVAVLFLGLASLTAIGMTLQSGGSVLMQFPAAFVSDNAMPGSTAGRIVVDVPGNQAGPAAAFNPIRNEYLVLWHDGFHIMGETTFLNGQRKGEPFIFYRDPPNDQGDPSVIYNLADDHYIAAWAEGGNIRIALGHENGMPTGQSMLIANNTARSMDHPSLAYNPETNTILMVMRQGTDLGAMFLDGKGQPLGESEIFLSGIGESARPSVALNNKKQYLVVYYFGGSVKGIFVNSDGTGASKPVDIAGNVGANPMPAVAYNVLRDEFLVLWNPRDDLAVQVLRGDGTPNGTQTRIVREAGNGSTPMVAFNRSRDSYLMLWSGKSRSGVKAEENNTDIYAMELFGSGQPVGQ
ncbi:MAG: response regulator transcription factor [Chloroflexi bacterium]|nr:response regulator transcription factor [Chloroflexota bacterium]